MKAAEIKVGAVYRTVSFGSPDMAVFVVTAITPPLSPRRTERGYWAAAKAARVVGFRVGMPWSMPETRGAEGEEVTYQRVVSFYADSESTAIDRLRAEQIEEAEAARAVDVTQNHAVVVALRLTKGLRTILGAFPGSAYATAYKGAVEPVQFTVEQADQLAAWIETHQ